MTDKKPLFWTCKYANIEEIWNPKPSYKCIHREALGLRYCNKYFDIHRECSRHELK